MSEVRTRIAPSPTGGLHIGHIRTMLYDYALSKQSNGQFVVRIEDTDQKRYVPGAVEVLLEVIELYGLTWDEGPRVGGQYEPYIQSQRLEIYKKYALELVEKGYAYYCFMNEAETKELQERSRLEKRKLRSPYRDYPKVEIEQLLNTEKPYVIRLKVPENREISFDDAVLGKITYNTNELDDQVLLKSDGFPTYHLAVVIDDHLMNITHILRGNDWLPSTPKHILLYEAFGWEIPVHAHLPNLKDKDSTKKLSKRHGAVFAIQFLEQGYLPKAILNFLMLVGWSSPEERKHGEKEKEIYTLEEFVKLFSLERVQKTALVSFDREKLLWFNQQYIKSADTSELATVFVNWLKKFQFDNPLMAEVENDVLLIHKIKLVQERAKTLVELLEMIKFFYQSPENINWNIKQTENFSDKINGVLQDVHEVMKSLPEEAQNWSQEKWVEDMRSISNKYGLKGGDSFMVLRLAIVGEPFSPPLFEAMQLLGKTNALNRIQNSIKST